LSLLGLQTSKNDNGKRAKNKTHQRERDIPVLDHVPDLPPHRHEKERAEVDEQDRPEDGHVEQREQRGDEREPDAARARPPELEFGQPALEGAELVGALGGEGGPLELGVDLLGFGGGGGEKREERREMSSTRKKG